MMCFSLLKQPIISSKNGYALCFEILFFSKQNVCLWNNMQKFEKKNTLFYKLFKIT